MKKLIVAALVAAACSLSPAQEVLVSGSVERISLLPPGTAECPKDCPQMFTPLPDGATRVCISNYCGCQVTDIKVDKVLLGADPGAILHVKSCLGEWCKPSFPISTALLLVQVKDGAARWSDIEARDGAETFDAMKFNMIGRVPAASLKSDQGKVTLDELRKALSGQR
jgi:hypothetical protein